MIVSLDELYFIKYMKFTISPVGSVYRFTSLTEEHIEYIRYFSKDNKKKEYHIECTSYLLFRDKPLMKLLFNVN